jgi:hypothetical protein
MREPEMTYTTYEAKENTPDGFRGLVVTQCEQGHGRVDFVTADDETHVISFEDLAFLVRAAASLPRHILEPDLMPPVVQVVADEEKEKAEPSKRPALAGGRWSEDQEAHLRDLYHKGLEVPVIAADLKRSPAAIVSRLLAMNLIEVTPKR